MVSVANDKSMLSLNTLRAIELAGKVPDAPFGAMIVDRDNGKILSEGWNKTSVNPTCYGEIDAINPLAWYLDFEQIRFELRAAGSWSLILACSRDQAAIQIDPPPWWSTLWMSVIVWPLFF
jgi:hypothetical protein